MGRGTGSSSLTLDVEEEEKRRLIAVVGTEGGIAGPDL